VILLEEAGIEKVLTEKVIRDRLVPAEQFAIDITGGLQRASRKIEGGAHKRK
jgi:hypothetical protein